MTQPKPFVFVLMPFEDRFADVYELGIKSACTEVGAYCERVDEQIFDESILERIYNQIARADIIVSDMTDRNANVFYETGYAHALGKRVILLTQRAEDIPFDLKHYPHVVYGGSITALKQELRKRVEWAISHPRDELAASDPPIELWMHGQKVGESSDLPILQRYGVEWGEQILWLQVDIHNLTSIVVSGTRLRLSLIMEAVDANLESSPVVRLPDGRFLHHFSTFEELLPDGWTSTVLRFHLSNQRRFISGVAGIIRIASELTTREVPVTLRFYSWEQMKLRTSTRDPGN